jgi:hypothetical protein
MAGGHGVSEGNHNQSILRELVERRKMQPKSTLHKL